LLFVVFEKTAPTDRPGLKQRIIVKT